MKPPTQVCRTPEQARAAMKAEGVNLREWCRSHDLNYWIVHSLLIGKLKGNRGKTFKAAVALGLKPAPITEHFTPQKAV